LDKLRRFLDVVDNISEWSGRIAWVLIPILMLSVTYEVITRYIFHTSNIWAFYTDQLLLIIIVGTGGSWALLHRGHVNVDIVYSHFSRRVKAIADVITYPIIFAVLMVLLREFGSNAFDSLRLRETTQSTWAPPVYPIKLLALLGIFIFLLQSLTKFVRDLVEAITGRREKKKYVGMFEKEDE
jgi:TRAP-type mannitol/chloroaromatic compound transport system permease small subunit